jgi:hypothetical protein
MQELVTFGKCCGERQREIAYDKPSIDVSPIGMPILNLAIVIIYDALKRILDRLDEVIPISNSPLRVVCHPQLYVPT